MIARPDLQDESSPDGMEVYQLTSETDVPSCHIYMEAQVFSPDSKRVLVHRSAHPHGSDKNDPEHRYLLCDLENGGELIPVTKETGATAPSITADGRHLLYFVNETEVNSGRLLLKRRDLHTGELDTITVIDKPIPGTHFRPSRIYPLSTISSDSQRIAVSAFLGDGVTAGPAGLMVFDIATGDVNVILHGPSWINIHPQYCRSTDEAYSHDILVQENHGCHCDMKGEVLEGVSGLGCDIHVIRDDGHNFRNMPWGRDPDEACQGHQCWRGRSPWAITSTGTINRGQGLIESLAIEHIDHDGLQGKGGIRNHLSRDITAPGFHHFATDIEGQYFISDNGPLDERCELVLARLAEAGKDALLSPTHLIKPMMTAGKGMHTHPFLSPDGKTAFFNSNESGILQAYMIRNLPELSPDK